MTLQPIHNQNISRNNQISHLLVKSKPLLEPKNTAPSPKITPWEILTTWCSSASCYSSGAATTHAVRRWKQRHALGHILMRWARGNEPQQRPCTQDQRQCMTFAKGRGWQILFRRFHKLISNCQEVSRNHCRDDLDLTVLLFTPKKKTVPSSTAYVDAVYMRH